MLALLLGTLAFAGLGLLMAGALRAEATLALANALFIAFLLLGGHHPAGRRSYPDRWRRWPASSPRPPWRTSSARRSGPATWPSPCSVTGDMAIAGPVAILLVWGVGSVVLAARTFRWE